MSTVSEDPTSTYNPYIDLKLNIFGLSKNRETSAGTATVCIILYLLDEPLTGLSCIKIVTVASAVSCTLVISTDLMLTDVPGAISSFVSNVDPTML